MTSKQHQPGRLWAFQVAYLFEDMARYLALNQADPFQIKTYERAGRALKAHAPEVPVLAAEGRLSTLKGLGTFLVRQIEDFQRCGRLKVLDDLKKQTAPETTLLLRLPGLKNEQIALISALGLRDLGSLEKAAASGRLTAVPGLGPAATKHVEAGINFLKPLLGRHLWPQAQAMSHRLANWLKNAAGFWRLEPAGDLRRGRGTVGPLELVGCGPPGLPRSALAQAAVSALAIEKNGWVKTCRLEKKPASEDGLPAFYFLEVGLADDFQARLYLTEAEYFPAFWHYFSASPPYLAELKAACPGLNLFPPLTATCHPDETRLFEHFQIPFIDPLLREGQGEVQAARQGLLPVTVVREDLRGFFHAHTTASDGQLNLEELVRAAQAERFEYVGLSDHSQSDTPGHGLSLSELAAQKAEVERVRALNLGPEIFWGLESAILTDGSLDYPPEILADFDFIIASVHFDFELPAADQTARIIKALQNPFTSILGHPLGRELLTRPAYECRIKDIIRAAISNGCALEINSQPHRLDLPWPYLKEARDQGAKFFISPDIHAKTDLNTLTYGITAARKGWLRKTDVLNTLPLSEIKAWLNWRKRRVGTFG